MLLDSFTVIAQLINFLLLIWLLKRFLYRPILRAIDSREQRLRSEQEQARQQQQHAQQQQQQLTAELENLEIEKQAILTGSRQQAKQQSEQWLEEQRQQIEEQRRRWQQQLCQDQQAVQRQLVEHGQRALIDSLRRILTELADQPLEQQVCQVFVTQLRTLPAEQHQQLAHALSQPGSPPLIHSSFALTAPQQQRLRELLKQQWGCQNVTFNQDPGLICGLELATDDHKVSWSIANHLDHLQQQLQTQLLQNRICNKPSGEQPGEES
ncbi:MAG: F0F1 ATP synthase subunit delta [Desulfuromonas sp.]|nr:F0F1 ATP synthase subunit delta [Desulfuromonas sp.]